MAKSQAQKEKEAKAKIAKEKEKTEAKEKADLEAKEKADLEAKEKKKEAENKFIKGCHYVAPGKTVVTNSKGYLNGGSLVKPEWFSIRADFDFWVEKGFIVKK